MFSSRLNCRERLGFSSTAVYSTPSTTTKQIGTRCGRPPSPTVANRATLASAASRWSSGNRVRVFLGGQPERALHRVAQVPLLDRQLPLHELPDVQLAGALAELAQHRPVPDLARLRHRQELEAVERIGVGVEVRRHQLARLLLDRARLVED